MGRSCVIEGCKSRSGHTDHKGVTFHSFPLNPDIRSKWLSNCRVSVDRNITKSTLVCSRHFKRTDFLPKKHEKFLLRPGIAPTVFPWGEVPGNPPIKAEDLKNESGAPPVTSENSVPEIILEVKDNVSEGTSKEDKRKKSVSKDDNDLVPPNQLKIDEIEPIEKVSITPELPSENVPKTEPIFFVAGVKIEAQDFDGAWHTAVVNEVDNDEGEVLIKFEKVSGKPGGSAEEWIPQNSSRLRPISITSDNLNANGSNKSNGFVVGERCMAKWNNSMRYPAVVTQILENQYQVLFDDGFTKVVKANHITKWKDSKNKMTISTSKDVTPGRNAKFTPQNIKSPKESKTSKDNKTPKSGRESKSTRNSNKWSLISKDSLDLDDLNLPVIPEDGEWCCHWVNDQPIGKEGFLTVGDHKKPTVVVDDWRLPVGWVKHMYQRSNVLGKWDVILVSPHGKRFRSKADLKQFLEEQGKVYNPDIYDFSIHRRRAKDINAYAYTKDYKPPPVVVKDSYADIQATSSSTPILTKTLLNSPATPTSVETAIDAINSELLTTPLSEIDKLTSDKAIDNLKSDFLPSGSSEDGYVYVGSLKVQIIDNLFRCPQESCNKHFRKENHVLMHVKHYHSDLAKQLSDCPNMQQLAYKRTVGTPNQDEPLPKNHLSNSQFFAKVYQQDLQFRSHRSKSVSTFNSSTETSPQINMDIVESEILKTPSPDNVEEENIASVSTDITIPKPSTPSKCLSSPTKSLTDDKILDDFRLLEQNLSSNEMSPLEMSSVLGDISTTPPINQLNESEFRLITPETPLINTPVSTSTGGGNRHRKLNTSRKSNRQRTTRKFLAANLRNPSKIFNPHIIPLGLDLDDSSNMFGPDSPEIGKPSKRLKLSQSQESIDTSETMRTENESVSAFSARSNYIDENGEVIKIVRMKQEEIINCLCSFGEEDGLMVQCELCLCWQHGLCNGIEKESAVPEKYVCYICRNPQRGRLSKKYIHDQEWLYEGKLPVAKYHAANPKASERFEILKKSHTLTGNLLEMQNFFHSLRVKMNIAANKGHPKMYLWATKWESPIKEEGGRNEEGNLIDENDLLQSAVPQPEAAIDSSECQMRLLEHIKNQQLAAIERLQKIETEIEEIEALDNTPMSPTQTREVISTLIKDLEVMKNISVINSKPKPYPTY